MARLEQLLEQHPGYRLAPRHDVKHFHRNSLYVERVGGRLVVMGTAKAWRGKNFRVVGYLKRHG